jgi:hypothetical protein
VTHVDSELVEVYRSNRMDAEIVRSVLEDSGIEVLLSMPGTSAAYPLGVGTLGEGRLLVRQEDESKARSVIVAALEAPAENGPESP